MPRSGFVPYPPLPDGVPAPADSLRPELADVRRLLRRGVRAVVGAARAEEPTGLHRIIADHLGIDPGSLEVVEETWPGYEHVNVQAGLDAWLAEPGRSADLVGVVGHQHRPFGPAELLDTRNAMTRTLLGSGG